MAAQLIIASVIVVAVAAAIAILLGVLVVRHRATTSRAASPDEWMLVAPNDPSNRDHAGRTDPVSSSSFRQAGESELAYRMRTAQRAPTNDANAPRSIVPPPVAPRPAGPPSASTARPQALAGQPPAARRSHRRVLVFTGGIVALVVAAVAVAIPTWTGAVLDSRATGPADGSTPLGVPGIVDGSVQGTPEPSTPEPSVETTAPGGTPRRTAAPGGGGGGSDTTGGGGAGGGGAGGGGPQATPHSTPQPTARATQPPTPEPTPRATPTPDPTPTPTPRPTPTRTPAPTPTPTPPPAADPPIVDFDWTPNGLSVRFANRTKHAVSWTWDFGDGATSTARNPTHVYDDGGSYTVKLTAVSDSGDAASKMATVTVQP